MTTDDRPLMLDLYCGAGGAAAGYARAGFRVVGVDIMPQPRYPFEFVKGDALEYLREHWRRFDAFHASPPCQRYTGLTNVSWLDSGNYPDLLPLTRCELQRTGKPYVIENVIGAPMHGVMLCGLMFGLKMFRHRKFESNVPLLQPQHKSHKGHKVGENGFVCMAGNGDANFGKGKGKHVNAEHRRLAAWQAASEIDWMLKREMRESIPPAFTEYIGQQLMGWLRGSQPIEHLSGQLGLGI